MIYWGQCDSARVREKQTTRSRTGGGGALDRTGVKETEY